MNKSIAGYVFFQRFHFMPSQVNAHIYDAVLFFMHVNNNHGTCWLIILLWLLIHFIISPSGSQNFTTTETKTHIILLRLNVLQDCTVYVYMYLLNAFFSQVLLNYFLFYSYRLAFTDYINRLFTDGTKVCRLKLSFGINISTKFECY